MKLFIFVIGLFLAHVFVQGNSNIDERAQECIKKLNISRESIWSFVVNSTVDENNEVAVKYFGCILDAYFTDSNELIVNEEYTSFVTTVFAKHFRTEPVLVRELAEESIQICKHIKADTKEKTAVQITNCLMKTAKELKNKKL
ncbi:hypothetical protein ILUMI_12195 [Ignelater luminosus]|uniref:Uncharacterized protein n=1 Tax=Ignelater luminosus TaxID=2038154 RepID=A0A8K0CUL1_IGNLU|nr:hypothetical protein ILUMI_12195 [Ignelater luminosus]